MDDSFRAAFYFPKGNRIDAETSIGGKIQDGQKKDL
jgi:hypothetical protein